MTFEEALKRLAEREPEKFRCGIDTFHVLHKPPRVHAIYFRNVMSQDFIDVILEEIGWEYELIHKRDQKTWIAWIWRTNDSGTLIGVYSRPSRTKLEAAKSALVAVVEKEYPL